ncbi:MAG: HD domain-containing protein [Lachnospiraceae bacterium]|nr:HD domain-containing protein [Lachnospiraceae bacterium]
MAMKLFAAIEAGSFGLSMKIFEYQDGRMREIESLRHSMDMGTDAHALGRIKDEHMDEIFRVLREFQSVMKSYKVTEYTAYGTSALREVSNTLLFCDQVEQRTGIRIQVLSNTEQRYLNYKAIAAKSETFQKIIEQGTAIVDICGGGLQISLFDKDTLVCTQQLRLGLLRLQDQLQRLKVDGQDVESRVLELANPQLSVFKRMYLKGQKITNVIMVDEHISRYLMKKTGHEYGQGFWDGGEFAQLMDRASSMSKMEISRLLQAPEDRLDTMMLSGILLRRVMEVTGAEVLWVPGAELCDGIGYDYGEKHKLIVMYHDFEKDIIASVNNISKRYMGSKKRSETLERLALAIFDSVKKVHGLGKRERLLLRISALLHDCGKYISITTMGACSYSIIMATEIIGLSHLEQEMVANIVRFNHDDFEEAEGALRRSVDNQTYLTIAKLTAILRVANGLDRSHKQKFDVVKCQLKDDKLVISVETEQDISLEKGLVTERTAFFEQVFNVNVVIRQRRTAQEA